MPSKQINKFNDYTRTAIAESKDTQISLHISKAIQQELWEQLGRRRGGRLKGREMSQGRSAPWGSQHRVLMVKAREDA